MAILFICYFSCSPCSLSLSLVDFPFCTYSDWIPNCGHRWTCATGFEFVLLSEVPIAILGDVNSLTGINEKREILYNLHCSTAEYVYQHDFITFHNEKYTYKKYCRFLVFIPTATVLTEEQPNFCRQHLTMTST